MIFPENLLNIHSTSLFTYINSSVHGSAPSPVSRPFLASILHFVFVRLVIRPKRKVANIGYKYPVFTDMDDIIHQAHKCLYRYHPNFPVVLRTI